MFTIWTGVGMGWCVSRCRNWRLEIYRVFNL